MLKQKVQDDLKSAMLAKDERRTSVLRLLLSAIGYYEIEKGGAGYEATDENVLAVITKEAKQRRDSIEQFKAANRQELVDKESKELELLSSYLPEQMSKDEIRSLVQDAISQTGAKTMQDMGKVMGILMPKVKGKADGGVVSKIVKEKLSQNS